MRSACESYSTYLKVFIYLIFFTHINSDFSILWLILTENEKDDSYY